MAFPVMASVVNVASDDTLNLRAGPGVVYAVVADVGPAGEVMLSDRFFRTDDGAEWWLVKTETGDVGWVNGNFVDA